MNPASVFGYIYSGLRYPIEWALTHLHSAFHDVPVLSAIGAFGLAVIAVTLVIRGLLFPLFGWQLRTQRRVQAEQRLVAPQLQELRKKYKKEPQKLQEEMMKLYREHGISPFSSLSGCLPLLVQMPIIGGLYFGVRDAANALHGQDASFLWITNLGQSAADWIHSLGSKDVLTGAFAHPQAVLLPLAAALATVVQSKMMMQPPRPDMSDQERQAYNLSKNMVFLAPVMVFFFGFSFPQGVALYWVTQSVVMIAQQWVILGWGGLKVPSWFPGSGRVTPLSFPAAGAPAAAFTPRRGSASAPPRGGASSGNGRERPSGGRSPQRGGDRRPQGGRPGHGGGRRPAASQTGAARRRRGR